ncbi:MAG: phospholipase D-like domain-containing protein, partial [Acidobacteriota bacterium]
SASIGAHLPGAEALEELPNISAGHTRVRVVATVPMTAGVSRVDELVAALARRTLWLTDAYYAGTSSYVQALKEAAWDGVDVRLLVPGGTDIPFLRPLSRAGYRPLLEAGVRVFEWNGAMLHAKTAVADGHWARVGSSNLNIASWFGNCEMDLVVEDESFAREMEAMYRRDLTNATEIVLDTHNHISAPGQPRRARRTSRKGGGSGSAGRAATGALRIGNAVGAAIANRRAFEPVEARILATVGGLVTVLAVLFVFFPALLVWPAIALCFWAAAALFFRAYKLRRKRNRATAEAAKRPDAPESGRP